MNAAGVDTEGASGVPTDPVAEVLMLSRNNARMDVVHVAFDPLCGRHLAVAGLQSLQVPPPRLSHLKIGTRSRSLVNSNPGLQDLTWPVSLCGSAIGARWGVFKIVGFVGVSPLGVPMDGPQVPLVVWHERSR